VLTNENLPFCNLSLNFEIQFCLMDVKLKGVFTLPNETHKEARKGTQRENSQQALHIAW
jgi:hypothetical protein